MPGSRRSFSLISVLALGGLLAALPLGLAACDAGSAASPAQVEATCDQVCERAEECQAGTGGDDCMDGCTAAGGVARSDNFEQVTSCTLALECGESGLPCLENLNESPGYQAYVQTCETRLADCGLGGAVIELACNTELLKLFADEVLQSLEDCFEEPCTEIEDCVRDTVAGYTLPT